MVTVNEMAAKLTQKACGKLVENLRAMPPERQQWKPLDLGRPVFHQMVECVVVNNIVVKALRDRAFPPLESEFGPGFEKAAAENDTPEKMIASLEKCTDDLVAAIKAFPPAHLEETVILPFNNSVWTWAEVLYGSYWNMTYHEGQINYIQTLYGDNEYHA